MKNQPLVLLLVLPCAILAAEVKPGESIEEVRAALGAPRGQVRAGDRHLLYFDRGEVELKAGTVTRVAILSDEDYVAHEARRAAIAERVREAQASRTVAGEVLKAGQLASATFRNAPPAYQVAFWEDFSQRYPEVSCAEELSIARVTLAEQFEQRRARDEQEARVAELEARVAAAEARASQFSSYGYPSRNYFRGYRSAAPSFWPVVYHFNDSPTVATASVSTPPDISIYRGAPTMMNDRAGRDWRDGARRERNGDSDRGQRQSCSRNRL